MNEKGLYIEANLREYEEQFISTGTNPGKKELAVWFIPFLTASHCRTVKEAVQYIKEEYSWYCPYENGMPDMRGKSLGFLIGDASGEFGIIEVAENRVEFIPYQSFQGNYYIDPVWNARQTMGTGYGRAAEGEDESVNYKVRIEDFSRG